MLFLRDILVNCIWPVAVIVLVSAAAVLCEGAEIPSPDAPETEWTNYIADVWHAGNAVKGRDYERKTPHDKSCDVVTLRTAYEVEWVTKPYEAGGQACYYAAAFNKPRAGVIFLVKDWEGQKTERAFASLVVSSQRYAGPQPFIEVLFLDTKTGGIVR